MTGGPIAAGQTASAVDVTSRRQNTASYVLNYDGTNYRVDSMTGGTDYGGTGTTDPTGSINQAFTALSNGGEVFCNVIGTIPLSGPIQMKSNYQKLSGLGNGTRLKITNNINTNVIEIGATGVATLGIEIASIYIDGNGSNTYNGDPTKQNGIWGKGVQNSTFHDITILQPQSSCLRLETSDAVQVADNFFSGINFQQAHRHGYEQINGTNPQLTNCTLDGNTLSGVYLNNVDQGSFSTRMELNGAQGIEMLSCEAIKLVRCEIHNNTGIGIFVNTPATISGAGVSTMITSCNLRMNHQHNIQIHRAKHVVVDACNIYGAGYLSGGTTFNGVFISDDNVTLSQHNIVSDCNIFDNQASKTQGWGILENSGGGVDFNTFTGNKFDGNALGTITIVGKNTRAHNNPPYNPLGLLASPYDNTNNLIGKLGVSGTLTSAKTYTCTTTPLDLYLAGGTVTAMTKNAQTLCTSLPAANATPAYVHLEPTDTWSITFSVTPTTNLVFGN